MATVQFDVDGVLADFRFTFTRLAKALGETQTIVNDVDRVAWDDYGDLDKKAVSRVWNQVKRDPNFWLYAAPLVDYSTFKWINDLQDSHEIYFVTARVGVQARSQTRRWLEAQGVSSPAVVMSANKGDVADAIGADYAIDDKAGNAIYTAYKARACRSYIIDRPYNRFDHSTVGGTVRRAATLGDFLAAVEKGT